MDFLGLQTAAAEEFSIIAFLINLLLTIIFSSALGFLFQKCSTSFSDRRRLASTFVLLAVAIMCVISVVKNSLALSLGLVGALSIVRFRTAIKDPEELVFLFLCIVIGIAHGANQSVIGAAVFILSSILIVLRYLTFNKFPMSPRYTHLILSGPTDPKEIMESVENIIQKFALKSELRRVDSAEGHTELILDVIFPSNDVLKEAITSFRAQGLLVTYMSN